MAAPPALTFWHVPWPPDRSPPPLFRAAKGSDRVLSSGSLLSIVVGVHGTEQSSAIKIFKNKEQSKNEEEEEECLA